MVKLGKYKLKNLAPFFILTVLTIRYKIIFQLLGKNSKIVSPLKLQGTAFIRIYDDVTIQYKTWLAATPIGNSNCLLSIGKGSQIGHFNHIYATKEIIIEDFVLTADKVYISDNLHNYEDINRPILLQGVKQINPVRIGSGSWIGENVCVIGASIGKNCVIGANSVVTKDIPDFCVAVGSPAKVIKRYNSNSKQWEKI